MPSVSYIPYKPRIQDSCTHVGIYMSMYALYTFIDLRGRSSSYLRAASRYLPASPQSHVDVVKDHTSTDLGVGNIASHPPILPSAIRSWTTCFLPLIGINGQCDSDDPPLAWACAGYQINGCMKSLDQLTESMKSCLVYTSVQWGKPGGCDVPFLR